MDESAESRPPLPAKPSKVPSWVMLGFILGALFMWALPPRRPEVAADGPVPREELPAPLVLAAPRLTNVEAVFAEWGRYAVWENDLTEVALWNPEAKAYTDYFEVMRAGDSFYFRSVPGFTRPVLTHGVKDNSPLQFTEPESHRQEWLHEVTKENWRAFSGSVRDPPKPGNAGNPPARTAVSGPAPPPVNPYSPPAPRTGTGDGQP